MSRVKLTDSWLSRTKISKTKRLSYVDALCPGLHVRVSPKGIRTFSVLTRFEGRLLRVTIGRFPRWSVAQARAEARRLLQSFDGGLDPRPEPVVVQLSYENLVEEYDRRHLQPNTRSADYIRANLRHVGLAALFGRPATAITKREFAEAIDGIVRQGRPQSALNVLRNLKMMYNWAVDMDVVATNPCDRIRPPAKTVERDRVLADAEIVAVWRAIQQLPYPYRQMYAMWFLSGQRRSEVATMRWCDISGNVWTIPREVVKKDRPHTVPLSPMAMEILKSTYSFGPDSYVFTTSGGKAPSSNFHKIKREVDRLSGVKGWTIHDIRRTVRSKMAELRIPREIARKVLNHEDGKIDRIYNRHEYLAEKREALEKWANHLSDLIAR